MEILDIKKGLCLLERVWRDVKKYHSRTLLVKSENSEKLNPLWDEKGGAYGQVHPPGGVFPVPQLLQKSIWLATLPTFQPERS
jgi:hypothetical protein